MSSVFSSWKNLRRTPWQSLTALLAVMTTFFMVFTVLNTLYMGDRVLRYFETRPEILVFFDTSVSDAEATQSAELIGQLAYVEEVQMTGKADAFAKYQAENADEPLLLSLLSEDLFPVSLSIKANSPEGLNKIRAELEKLPGIDEIDYHQDVVDQFLNWTRAIRVVNLSVCALFTIQFIMVVTVITSMKVAARRRTIGIMSILGAGRGTIKGTFVREAMWLGFLGSGLAFGVSYGLLVYLQPTLQSFFGEIAVLPLPTDFLLAELGGGVVAAMILSALAAGLATTKLIKK